MRDGREHTIFLVTSDGIVVGDPLSATAARWLKAELESRFPGVPIRYVLVTHHHYARAEGVSVFSGAPESVAQDRYNDALNRARDSFDAGLRGLDRNDDGALDERELAGTADRAALSERDRNGDRKVKPRELYVRVSDVESHFDRDWRVTLGGRAVEMVHVGSTEAPEMSVIVFASERVVFASGVPPLTLQDGFGNYAPRDAQTWARKVDALAFDTMQTSDGRSISHADITAFSRYVATLLDVVADGHEAGRSAANLQASATLDAFRDTPFFAGRRAQIDAAYADLRLTNVDLYGAAMGRFTWPNASFCANNAECDQTTRVGGATVGLRTTVSRFGVIAEAMFGAPQRESARGTAWSFEHGALRCVSSVLASFGPRPGGGFSMAVVGGMSMTVIDTSGLAVMRGVWHRRAAPRRGSLACQPVGNHRRRGHDDTDGAPFRADGSGACDSERESVRRRRRIARRPGGRRTRVAPQLTRASPEMRSMLLKASRVAHQRSDLPRALVFLAIFSVSVCACDRISIPTEPTASVAPPASSLPPLPPAPPPAYSVSGVVTDGSSFGPNGGLNTGNVTILDGAQAGTTVPIFTGGSYTLRNLPAGSVTLEASSPAIAHGRAVWSRAT